jgi:polyisoprenyl-phosphate glycosyltransferase
MKKDNIDLSIVIPCYNEKDNIPLIVKRFNEIKPENINVELILVDNGSVDSSGAIIDNFVKKYDYIKKAKVEKNVGYGFGILTGLRAAKGQFLCWTHADMQTDLGDTIKAYQIAINQKSPYAVFVKGRRGERSLFDAFFTSCMSLFETIYLETMLYDINAQPNLFHRSLIDIAKDPPNDFSFDLYFYYISKKKKYKIIRFPVIFSRRIHGKSSWNTGIISKWKFIKRTIKFSFGLKKRLRKEKLA